MELTSIGFILYVYFTNRRVHKHWSHLVNTNQMLPVRVSLRRNMDVAGALIASSLLHALCYGILHTICFIVFFLNAPRIPPVTLVSRRTIRQSINYVAGPLQ